MINWTTNRTGSAIRAALVGVSLATAAAGTAARADESKSEAQRAAPAIMEPLPPLGGPKRTVAVGKFDAIGAFTQKYGGWDIGGGLAAMLTSALLQSQQFLVVERAELKEVLSEQQLKAGGLVSPGTGPKLGKLAGVQLLIYGAVTEFGAEDKGGGVSLGFSSGSLPFTLGGAQQSASGAVAVDVRVVDTTTGEVLESHTVREPIESSAFNLSAGYQGISLGGDEFMKTPLGEASRNVIKKAVHAIADTARKRPWRGQVVEVDNGEVYINAGAKAGLKKGDIFMIERVTKVLTDPSTGQVLGTRSKELGIVTVSGVEEKLAYGPFKPLEPDPPRRGDFVVIMKR